ncbi:flagellar biosynthesis protein [Clostridium vincentii]|uniref:Flagellar assembly protein H n=1 Tax=Clostridium vincentii TaxID=52704 RepID=A0A2T0B6J4_9CLOT|nr:flagellar biosynthesis protein [Clostridium vincentii]PRR79433.1 flagellar assembly protein H [Clostridium vincentii]
MQSSYSLIKKDQALSGEQMKISTNYVAKTTNESNSNVRENESNMVGNFEVIGASIIKEAQRKRDQILIESKTQAALIEKNAYEKGYNQGIQNGHEDGKKEAIAATIPKAKKEATDIINNAEKILSGAEQDYNEYLKKKTQDIIKLAFSISGKILKKEVLKDDGIDLIIDEAFKLAKGEQNIIIRCNRIYEEQLKEKIKIWKVSYNITGEIFIIVSDDIQPGNAIIEKNSGKMEVGVDIGLEKIMKAIIG